MRRVIIAFALVAPVLLVLAWPYSPWLAVGILALSHALLLYPTLRPNVQWLGPVITHFSTDAQEAWLTIDDGPTDDTIAILDLLDARGAKATFFVLGVLAERRADLMREIVARGHSVANHSRTHPAAWFWCLPPSRLAREIDGGIAARWFRAPVGMKNPFVHPLLAKRGLHLIGWTVRGFDSVVDDAERVAARIVPRVSPGAIVVMHQGRSWSVRTIARVVDELQARGFSFVIPNDTQLKM